MDAWTVYWLFQLDSIKEFFGVFGLSGLFFALLVLLIFIGYGLRFESYQNKKLEELGKTLHFWSPFIALAWILCAVVATFTPSTKTMAAIIVLPKIVSAQNIEVVSKDAGDIYKLAMVRIKDALGETEADSKQVK